MNMFLPVCVTQTEKEIMLYFSVITNINHWLLLEIDKLNIVSTAEILNLYSQFDVLHSSKKIVNIICLLNEHEEYSVICITLLLSFG